MLSYFNKFMINNSPKITRSRKTDLSDAVSEESLPRTSKKLERTNSNKSNRSNDSCNSHGSNSSSTFYVKNVFLSHLHQRPQEDDHSTAKKVRAPTPCKSRKEINGRPSEFLNNEAIKAKAIEFNLKIGELQSKIKEMKHRNQRLEHQATIQHQKIAKLEGEIIQKEKRVTTLIQEGLESKKKIMDLERTIMEGETSLKHANNNLDRLKKAINDNKVTDLKKQNAEQRKELEKSLEDLAKLSKELMLKDESNIKLEKENMTLKNKVAMEKNCRNESMREKFLEKEVKRLKEEMKQQKNIDQNLLHQHTKALQHEKHSLEGEVKKLRIQLDYLQRKHMEELKIFCRAKNQEVQLLQLKYTELQKKYKQLRKDFNIKNQARLSLLGDKVYLRPERQNILQSEHSRKRKGSIIFELSPE